MIITTVQLQQPNIMNRSIFSTCTFLKARPILRELSNTTSSANNCTRIHMVTYTNRTKILKLYRVKTDLPGRFPRDQATETSGHLWTVQKYLQIRKQEINTPGISIRLEPLFV